VGINGYRLLSWLGVSLNAAGSMLDVIADRISIDLMAINSLVACSRWAVFEGD
jgi:hypothetical protein